MKEMIDIVREAKERRALLLAEFKETGWTVTKFAKSKNLTPERMSQILIKARMDAQNG